MWNGTTPSLKAIPAITKTRPKTKQQAAIGVLIQRGGDRVQVQAAGHAVEDRDPVEHHARGECPEDKILHRRLGSGRGVPVHGNHGIEREGHKLQAEVDGQEIVGRDHHHHPEHREEAEHEILAAQERPRRQIIPRIDEGPHGDDEDRRIQHRGQEIADEQAVEGETWIAGAESDGQ